MDVPLGDHVTLQLPLQVVVVPPQDLVGDVEVVVVVKLASGEVEVSIEIAPLCQPQSGGKWRGQPPRLNKLSTYYENGFSPGVLRWNVGGSLHLTEPPPGH